MQKKLPLTNNYQKNTFRIVICEYIGKTEFYGDRFSLCRIFGFSLPKDRIGEPLLVNEIFPQKEMSINFSLNDELEDCWLKSSFQGSYLDFSLSRLAKIFQSI